MIEIIDSIIWNSLPESLKSIQPTSLFKHSPSVFLLTEYEVVSLNCAHVCLMHLAPCITLLIIVIIIFTMGGQLRWALCLSGNHTLCFVVVIVQCFIFVILWRINLLSLSPPVRATKAAVT